MHYPPDAQRPSAHSNPSVDWRTVLAPYAQPDGRRGAFDVVASGTAFVALFGTLMFGLHERIWPALVLVPIVSLVLVRLFTLQHDCGHGSLFRSRRANDWVGRVIGVLMLTPYGLWRRNHASHHAGTGNLARRGVGDLFVMTLREYQMLSPFRRWCHRFRCHPLILFVIGPTVQYWVLYRFQVGNSDHRRSDRLSMLYTNGAIAAAAVVIAATVGLGTFLLAYVPVAILTASTGVWLFHVQHNFERAYWRDATDWNYEAAALQGGSLYDLPRWLHWATNNICFHHIHHLASRIPGHRLRRCFEANACLQHPNHVALASSWRLAWLALWDEEAQRLISLRSCHRRSRATARAHRSVVSVVG